MYFLYWGLLLLWLTLLWPAYRLRGGARAWLLVVVCAALAALGHEIRMFLWSAADIRLDILLISAALVCLHASAAVLLFVKRWRRTAVLLGLALALIGGAMGYRWHLAGLESQSVRAAFEESNRLLFRARFRSAEVYERRFGPFTSSPGEHPIGHWRVDEPWRFTRLIVNAERRAFLFYQCQVDAECHYESQPPGLQAIGDSGRRWAVRLKPPVGEPVEMELTHTDPGTIAAKIEGQGLRLVKEPPPIDPTPAPRAMRFLGSFASAECLRAHATVRQIWLWEEGVDAHAVGVFSTLVAGRHAAFVSPAVMGRGVREGEGWRFAWTHAGRSATARVALRADGAILTLDQEGRDREDADGALLERGGVFSDERVELAPLSGGEDWRRWFATVLVGHFVAGEVPACG